MNQKRVIADLEKLYPGKKIIRNKKNNPTEIICEVDPTEEHGDYSIAITVIDQSIPHTHKVAVEEYEVMKGVLRVVKDGREYVLHEGDKLMINPGVVHHAFGQETWVKVYARPGWKPNDHIFV